MIGASLVASRLVSMTFIPLLGYYLLQAEGGADDRGAAQVGLRGRLLPRSAGMAHPAPLGVSRASLVVLLAGGGLVATQLQTQFFPKDLQYLS